MEAFLQPASEFIGRHHEWAAVVLGVTTFLESLVLLGAFVPATALMVLAGGLIAKGVLEPFPVVFACVTGAVIGDAISFAVGRRLGRHAFRHPALAPHRRSIARTRLLCRRYGSASVYLGRFLGPLRAFVPVMVGMLRMRRRQFQVANVISGLVWVLVMLAPGYFAAKGFAELEIWTEADGLTLVIAGSAAALALGLAGTRIVRAFLRNRTPARVAAARAR